MHKFLRSCILLAVGALLFLEPTRPAHTESVIPLGNNRIALIGRGVDDHLRCNLNGTPVLSLDFGQAAKTVELTAQLKTGSNSLTCQVTDDQGGACYSYDVSLIEGPKLEGPDEDVTEVLHEWSACCQRQSCRGSNPVLNRTIFINKP